MPTMTATSPAAKVRLPAQSMRAGWRTPRSSSLRYAQTVPNRPIGTEIRKMRRQSIGPRMPPSTSPMNMPPMAAAWLMPRAMPRWCAGKASVRMAAELASRKAAPTACKTRMTTSHSAPLEPDIQVTVSSSETTV